MISNVGIESSVPEDLGPDGGLDGLWDSNGLGMSENELYKFGTWWCSLLGIGSELFKHDPLLGLGVDVGTGVMVPKPTGVCCTALSMVSMGLNLVRLNPISVRSSMFLILE